MGRVHVTFLFFNRHANKMEIALFTSKIIPLRKKLLAYSAKLAGGQVEAEDVVQDVFLKLWTMRDSLDGYDSVEALAFTITKNKTLDELKRCRSESLDNMESSAYPVNFEGSDSLKIIEEKDLVEHVKRYIEALPALQQTIIRMKDVEGYELTDIAAITGAQNEAVRVNLSRARKKIRAQLIRLYNFEHL